jgi:hypothetical protein
MKRKKHTEHIKDFPYYKIQYWDEFSICWVYIHKTFPDPQKAENYALIIGKRYKIGKKYRIMEVMPNGQKPFKTSG